MTLRPAGTIAGRPYAVRRDPGTDEALAYVCLDCTQETKPGREQFERHKCRKPRADSAAAETIPATEVKDEAR
jgi:hypothetical protein